MYKMRLVLGLVVGIGWAGPVWALTPTPTVPIDRATKSTHVTALELDNLTSHAPVPVDETSTRVSRCTLYMLEKALWAVCNDGSRWVVVAAP